MMHDWKDLIQPFFYVEGDTWELFTKEATATGKVTGGVITVLTGALPHGSYISVETGILMILS